MTDHLYPSAATGRRYDFTHPRVGQAERLACRKRPPNAFLRAEARTHFFCPAGPIDNFLITPSVWYGYLSGVNCTPELAQKSFMATKNLYGKADGIFFYQYVQSFSPKEEVTPEEAHQIAQELAERFFPGCEVLVATHMDT